MAEAAQAGRFHWSPDDPLCPLCGQHLGLPPVPEKPCETLGALTLHFEGACPVTARVSPLPGPRPRRR